MRGSVDRAARLVLPKRIRDKLGLAGDKRLEIEDEHGLVSADFDPPPSAITPEEVREALERNRR